LGKRGITIHGNSEDRNLKEKLKIEKEVEN
jgi:hypothetical protein